MESADPWERPSAFASRDAGALQSAQHIGFFREDKPFSRGCSGTGSPPREQSEQSQRKPTDGNKGRPHADPPQGAAMSAQRWQGKVTEGHCGRVFPVRRRKHRHHQRQIDKE